MSSIVAVVMSFFAGRIINIILCVLAMLSEGAAYVVLDNGKDRVSIDFAGIFCVIGIVLLVAAILARYAIPFMALS